jgi:aryl-alcohol dehydrogenase-like predicted oxidoreductase
METWHRIGYGTWPLASDVNGSVSYGKVEEDVAIYTLKKAYDWGINFYDTADFYGFGYVEELVSKSLRLILDEWRDTIFIATKGGMLTNDGKQNFSATYLVNTLRGSLQRLNLEYVDVFMLHSPPLSVLEDENLLPLLETIKDEGLTKEYGISLASPNDGFTAINEFGFKIIEVNYNILDHRAEDSGLFALCKEKRVKTIIRTPLGQGILSGEFQYNEDAADRRNQFPIKRVENQRKILRRMMESLNHNDYSDAKNCLRFCLSNEAVTTIIPGMKNVNEVVENTSALNAPQLTKEELDRIKNIYEEENL